MAAPSPPRPRVRRITLSPVGKETAGVAQPNNGADHGPDDAGTTTRGVQEFLNHHVAENAVGEWWPGVYTIPQPVVVPFYKFGFSWNGPGRDMIRIVPGPGCVGKDMISVAGSEVMYDVRIDGMYFGAKQTAVRHLVNFTNPSGPDNETSTRWTIRNSHFGGVGPTGFQLVMDYNEDSTLDDSHFFEGPSPNPGPGTGGLCWRIPRGMATLRNTIFARGTNPTYAYLDALTFALRDTVLPNQTELGSNPGSPHQLLLDHCWQEHTIPGRPNFLNNSGFALRAHLSSTWINAAGGQPVFGGKNRWDVILDQANLVGDGSNIPLLQDGAGSTVRGRNPVLWKGVTSPPIGL